MRSQNFNVTLVQPPGYIHSLALLEAAEYIHGLLLDCGYSARLSTNDFDPHEVNVLFCAHLLEARHIPLLPARVIIFNSEQLGNRDGWYFQNGVYGQLLTQNWVWDYASSHLACIPHQRTAYVPFVYSARLRRNSYVRSTEGNLLFYGSITPHRQRIFDELGAAGVAVDVMFGVYGRERDERLFSARAVLNLHNAETVDLFEPIRCFYPLINGIPVISEQVSEDETVAPFRSSVFFAPSTHFASAIATLLSQPKEFSDQANAHSIAFEKTSALQHAHRAVDLYLDDLK
jgi:hypothetical protein